MLLVVYIFCVILIFILGIKIICWIQNYRNFAKLINKIPGPATIPVLGNLLEICCSTEQLFLNLRNIATKYYPICKVWALFNSGVIMMLPEDVEIVISSTKHMEKGHIYELLHGWLGSGLLTSSGNKWHSRRKLLTPAFHFSILKQFLIVFDEQSNLLVKEIENECNKPYTDIDSYISKFTLNSICETAMGITPDNLMKKTEENYRTAIYRLGQFIVYRIGRPWLYNNLAFLFSAIFWKQQKLLKILHLYSLSVIRNRKNSSKKVETNTMDVQNAAGSSRKKRLAMLDLLIAAQKSDSSIQDEDIREEVDTFMFEGHDTTAVSICFTLMLLACHQDIQEKVREEVSKIIENSKEKYSYENLQELKYLEMVLKESLRLYPSVPLITRRTSENISTYSGYIVPKDTEINLMIYDIHRNPIYYPDPLRFDPNRFSPESCKNRHPFAYIPFSAGPRNCIGQRFAMLELKMVIAKIVQRFHLLPIDTPGTLEFKTDLLLRTTNGIRIKLEHRNI